jgi:HEAT repeat protein
MIPLIRLIILFACMVSVFACGPDSKDVEGWYEEYKSGKINKSQAIEQISGALKSKNYKTHMYAACYLGRLGDHRAYEPLLNIIKNSRECSDATWAIRVLGSLGDCRAVEHLLPLMEKPIVAVNGNTSRKCYLKNEAIKALGNIKDSRAVDPLIKKLNEEGGNEEIFYALGKIGDVRAVDPIIIYLNKYGSRKAVWALGELKDPRSIDPLIDCILKLNRKINPPYKLTKDGEYLIKHLPPRHRVDSWTKEKKEAAIALSKFGSQVIEPLKKRNKTFRDEVIYELKKYAGQSAEPIIAAFK